VRELERAAGHDVLELHGLCAKVVGSDAQPELAEARVFWLYDRVIVVPGAKGGEVVFTGTDEPVRTG